MNNALISSNLNLKTNLSLVEKELPVQNGKYLAAYGSKLIENGYQIIPIPQGGKSPTLAKWTKTKSDKTLLESWLKNGYSEAGIGILTRHTPCIDLDITDEKVLEEILEDIEFTHGILPKRIGRAPRCLLMFKTNEPFKKMQTGKFADGMNVKHEVEILADGQQFLAYAIHPTTNEPYRWNLGSTPLNTLACDLPVLTGAQCAELVKRCIRVFEKNGFKGESSTELKNVVSDNDDDENNETEDWALTIQPNFDETPSNIAKVKLALSYIPASCSYDEWRNMVFALKSTQWNCARDIAIAWSVNSDKFTLKTFNNLWDSAKVRR